MYHDEDLKNTNEPRKKERKQSKMVGKSFFFASSSLHLRPGGLFPPSTFALLLQSKSVVASRKKEKKIRHSYDRAKWDWLLRVCDKHRRLSASADQLVPISSSHERQTDTHEALISLPTKLQMARTLAHWHLHNLSLCLLR